MLGECDRLSFPLWSIFISVLYYSASPISAAARAFHAAETSHQLHGICEEELWTGTSAYNRRAPRSGNITKSTLIQDFWGRHFKLTSSDKLAVPCKKVYEFFKSTSYYSGQEYDAFCAVSGLVEGLRRTNEREQAYKAKPTTASAMNFLNTNEPQPTDTDVDFFLANIDGLITIRKNKCQQLHTYTTTKAAQRIIALTETHSKLHLTEEYKKHLPGFDIKRTDRDTEYDEKALKTKGGCMVITSADIPMNKIKEYSFSNGNCELLTVEIPTIRQAVMVVYRPSGKN